jgi:hypothetical protein
MWLRCAECQDLEENGALEPKMFLFSRFSAPLCIYIILKFKYVFITSQICVMSSRTGYKYQSFKLYVTSQTTVNSILAVRISHFIQADFRRSLPDFLPYTHQCFGTERTPWAKVGNYLRNVNIFASRYSPSTEYTWIFLITAMIYFTSTIWLSFTTN